MDTNALSLGLMLLAMSHLPSMTAAVAQPRDTISCAVAGNLPEGHIGVAGPFVGWLGKSRLLVAGGANFPDKMPWEGGQKAYTAAMWVCTESGNRWSCVESAQHLPQPLAYGTAVRTPRGLVCLGGEGAGGATNRVMQVTGRKNSAQLIARELPSLPKPLTNVSATAIGNIIYAVGGECNGLPQRSVYRLCLRRLHDGWERMADLPVPMSHAVVLGRGRGKHARMYVIGGRAKTASGLSDLYRTVYVLDVGAGCWKEETPLPHPLAAAAGVIDQSRGLIYVLGGDVGEVFHRVEEYLLAIATADSDQKAALTAAKNRLQVNHPGFNKTVWRYDTSRAVWESAGDLPVAAPVSTTAVWWDGKILLSSGEIRPGVRTPRFLAVDVRGNVK